MTVPRVCDLADQGLVRNSQRVEGNRIAVCPPRSPRVFLGRSPCLGILPEHKHTQQTLSRTARVGKFASFHGLAYTCTWSSPSRLGSIDSCCATEACRSEYSSTSKATTARSTSPQSFRIPSTLWTSSSATGCSFHFSQVGIPRQAREQQVPKHAREIGVSVFSRRALPEQPQKM